MHIIFRLEVQWDGEVPKDVKNQEESSLVGYENTERTDPAWMTLLPYLS